MVWVVEIHRPGDSEYDISIWDSETNALKNAATIIQDDVAVWDYYDQEIYDCASNINDEMSCGNYREGLRLYNEWQGNLDHEYQTFIQVYERALNTSPPHVPIMIMPAWQDPDEEEEEEYEEEYEEEENFSDISGATCRGCQNYNEYASPDNHAGTYCCYQCKSMGRS